MKQILTFLFLGGGHDGKHFRKFDGGQQEEAAGVHGGDEPGEFLFFQPLVTSILCESDL